MPMDAKERAVSEDAEGSLSVPGERLNKSPRLRTTQMEREILLDYCAGAEKDGVRCRVYASVVRKTAKTPRSLTFRYTAITGVTNIRVGIATDCSLSKKRQTGETDSKIQGLPRPKTQANSTFGGQSTRVEPSFLGLDYSPVYPSAIGACNADDGLLSVAEPNPGVDPGDEEALAPPAGEPAQRRVEADVEPQFDPPGHGRLFLRQRQVGVREVDCGLC